jgi:hypothetical protein
MSCLFKVALFEFITNARISDLQLVDRASFPLTTVRPRPWLYLGIALGAAVLAMLAAPILAHQNDTTVTSRRDLARLLNVSFVAAIPDLSPRRPSGRAWASLPDLRPKPGAGHAWARLPGLKLRLASGRARPRLPGQSTAPPEAADLHVQQISAPAQGAASSAAKFAHWYETRKRQAADER